MRVSKFWVYATCSIGVVAAMMYDAVSTHRQFFPTVVALTNSKPFGVALANGLFAALSVFCVLAIRLFFGKLQQNDRRQLTEYMAYHFIDTCIALSYFRDSLSTFVTALIVINGACRMFHHLSSTQLDNLEQTGQITPGKVQRLAIMLWILFSIDTVACLFYVSRIAKDGVSVYLLLALDSVLMALVVLRATIKLLFHQIEVCMGRMWDRKGVLVFYVELAFEFSSCFLYMAFFVTKFLKAQFPFHLVRELLVMIRRTKNTLTQFLRYRAMTEIVDKHFPDATPAQLEEDRTCAICYDPMEDNSKAKRLPCGHCFHYQCLRRWVERNTACPYCWQEFKQLAEGARNQQRHAARGQQRAQQRAQAAPPAAGLPRAEREVDANEEIIQAAYRAYLQAHGLAERPPVAAAVAAQEAELRAEAVAANQTNAAPQEAQEKPPPATAAVGKAARPAPLPQPESRPTQNPPLRFAATAEEGHNAVRKADADNGVDGPSLSLASRDAQPHSAGTASPPRTPSSPLQQGTGNSNILDLEEIAAHREYLEDCQRAERRLHERIERITAMRGGSPLAKSFRSSAE